MTDQFTAMLRFDDPNPAIHIGAFITIRNGDAVWERRGQWQITALVVEEALGWRWDATIGGLVLGLVYFYHITAQPPIRLELERMP